MPNHEHISRLSDSQNQASGFASLSEVPFTGNRSRLAETFGNNVKWQTPGVCRPYTNEVLFNKPRAWDVLESHRRDFRLGIKELRDWLADMFFIEPPELEFRPTRDSGAAGEFQPDNYKIILYYDPRRSKTGNLDDLNTIAHEMWHARQRILADYGNDARSDVYNYNFNCYYSADDSEDIYGKQVIEHEAFYFGDTVEKYFENHLEKGQDVVTAFQRAFRSKNSPRLNVVDGFLQRLGRKN